MSAQARILEWEAFPCSRGSSQPRDQTHCREILYQLSYKGSREEFPEAVTFQQWSRLVVGVNPTNAWENVSGWEPFKKRALWIGAWRFWEEASEAGLWIQGKVPDLLDQEVGKLWPPAYFCKYSFLGIQRHLFIYRLWLYLATMAELSSYNRELMAHKI